MAVLLHPFLSLHPEKIVPTPPKQTFSIKITFAAVSLTSTSAPWQHGRGNSSRSYIRFTQLGFLS